MTIPIGTRVRVKSLNHAVWDDGEGPLLGTVTGHDDHLDYCLVKLDRPVSYATVVGWADGQNIWATAHLATIREDAGNLEALPNTEPTP